MDQRRIGVREEVNDFQINQSKNHDHSFVRNQTAVLEGDDHSQSSDLETLEDFFKETFNSTYHENLEFAQVFEGKQKSLNVTYCQICNQMSLTSADPICNVCRKYPHPDQVDLNDPLAVINPFCQLNDMDPGQVPAQLKDLSFLEQLLISRVKVCLSVFKPRVGQFGYHGQVINFNQDVSELATLLPHSLDSLSNVLIVRRRTDNISSFSEFRVRRDKVCGALRYLIDNHSGYRNIVRIDSRTLDALPIDGSASNNLHS